MPEMKMHRNFRLASVSGHVIMFKKGEVVDVPKPAVKDALAAGGMVVSEADLDDVLPEEQEAKAVPQGDERESAILTAFQTLIEKNEREDFTAAGMPTKSAVDAATGFKADKKELGRLWTQFQEAQGATA